VCGKRHRDRSIRVPDERIKKNMVAVDGNGNGNRTGREMRSLAGPAREGKGKARFGGEARAARAERGFTFTCKWKWTYTGVGEVAEIEIDLMAGWLAHQSGSVNIEVDLENK